MTADGRELHVEFSSHPASQGGVVLRSEYLKPGSTPTPRVIGKIPDVFTALVLRPGGGNLMQVGVEVLQRDGNPSAPKVSDAADASVRSLFSIVEDGRKPIDADGVAMIVGGAPNRCCSRLL